jgi:hypothetical protein
MSYTFTPLRNRSSPSLSCRSVSMVLGCKPSALPVAVLLARSSRTVVLMPYRANVELCSICQLIVLLKSCPGLTYASIKPAGPAPAITTSSTWMSPSTSPFISPVKLSSIAIGAMMMMDLMSRNSTGQEGLSYIRIALVIHTVPNRFPSCMCPSRKAIELDRVRSSLSTVAHL